MSSENVLSQVMVAFVASVVCFVVVAGAQADYIANSVDEFSGTQGHYGWHYGSTTDMADYDADPSGTDDFDALASGYWNGTQWRRTDTGWFIVTDSDWAHPDTSHWNIRRWVSEVTGQITIDWHVSMEVAGSLPQNDGVIGRVFHNGTLLDSATIARDDTTGVDSSVTRTVAAGDYIDFALDARNHQGGDAAIFYATIVPEPSTFVLLGMGVFGLLLWWWRRK